MILINLALSLIATYLPAVAGARGRGSRRIWIVCLFLGLLVASVSIMIADAYGTDIQNELFRGGGILIGFVGMVIRASISFSIGSLLAVLLFRKAANPEPLCLR